jgi:Delta3-Delta2-enoyl-CoA isomerase
MLDTITHDDILELRLARPPVNALNPELIANLRQAIVRAPADGVRAIVLSGQPGIFSAGLDVPTLLGLDRDAMNAFWSEFMGLLGALARSPLPIVAAIAGHSPAGGAVLSLFCDYRVMARSSDAEKPFRIGLNEVQVGLVVPQPIQVGLRRLVGTYRAERLMVAGAMITSEEAERIGMVDELAALEDVVPRALAWCKNHLALPREAMQGTRRLARADLAAAFDEPPAASVQDFLDVWFSEEAQATLKALVERLKSGKS